MGQVGALETSTRAGPGAAAGKGMHPEDILGTELDLFRMAVLLEPLNRSIHKQQIGRQY